MSSVKQHAAAKVARASQANDPVQLADAKRELALANIEAAIERNLVSAPPLTPAQIKLLSGLLKGGQR